MHTLHEQGELVTLVSSATTPSRIYMHHQGEQTMPRPGIRFFSRQLVEMLKILVANHLRRATSFVVSESAPGYLCIFRQKFFYYWRQRITSLTNRSRVYSGLCHFQFSYIHAPIEQEPFRPSRHIRSRRHALCLQ
jgi:hypothetical protein